VRADLNTEPRARELGETIEATAVDKRLLDRESRKRRVHIDDVKRNPRRRLLRARWNGGGNDEEQDQEGLRNRAGASHAVATLYSSIAFPSV